MGREVNQKRTSRPKRNLTMNVSTIIVVLNILLVVHSARLQAQGDTDSTEMRLALETSRMAAKNLFFTVRSMLAKQLASGGPVGAIHICADSAQIVGERIQQQHNLSIRRVSEKWRNSKDIPDAFETKELQKLAALRNEGKLSDTLEVYSIVTEDSIRVFRYMKPILVGEMCLSCHGEREKMKDLVNEAIRLRYPNDKAIDYKAGELRGAVTVKLKMPK
jgi:hypothetical protein